MRLARNDLIPTSSTSLGEAPSQKARRGRLTAFVRYTSQNENFVLVLEGISRAKPLASWVDGQRSPILSQHSMCTSSSFFSSTAVRCSLVMGNSNSALRLRTSLFPHESTPSQVGFVDALYHRKVLDGYSSVTNAVGSDAGDARKAGAPTPLVFFAARVGMVVIPTEDGNLLFAPRITPYNSRPPSLVHFAFP